MKKFLWLSLALLLGIGSVFADSFPVNAVKETAYRNLDVGVTGQVVCAYPCTISNYFISNQAASPRYLKLYNKATAASETDTPVKTIVIPIASGANLSLGVQGMQFSTGLSIRATTTIADNSTAAPSTNDVVVNLGTVRYVTAP
jgi:hypothetical protein